MKLNILLNNGHVLSYEGTYQELVNLSNDFVDKWGDLIAGQRSAGQHPALTAASKVSEWTEQAAKELLDTLFGDQKRLVMYLIGKDGTATSTEIEADLGLAKQKLAGVLSSITRNAKKATGDAGARLVAWRGTADGKYQYYIVPEAVQYVSTSAIPKDGSPAN